MSMVNVNLSDRDLLHLLHLCEHDIVEHQECIDDFEPDPFDPEFFEDARCVSQSWIDLDREIIKKLESMFLNNK